MLKRLFFTFVIFTFALSVKAQLPVIKSNASEKDKSLIYKNLRNQYDFIIAYTAESYWWSNKANYNILALKNGLWLKGHLYSQKRKNDTWRKPIVILKEVDPDSASYIIKHLDSAGFYQLNRDSLNISERRINERTVQRISISDGVNCRFEILSKNDFLIIESYAPEFFIEKMPEIKSRGFFIKYRDWFLLKYKALSEL
ncbi:hypothetical protein [Mucilaginibacter sp.]|uniref:hypothetical protein n=1 Tax=Mucilaginibacter sp. TaxID=1882438 RepID=UPI002629188C|nr:hypothetical protein [Mucilaginibacter sp.]MDB4919267.1 hypothetical protein [Mucilaginibacter sp.]